jgi:hypothetical protein
LITGKLALKYAGKEIESMKAIGVASQKRSLAEFQKVKLLIYYVKNIARFDISLLKITKDFRNIQNRVNR